MKDADINVAGTGDIYCEIIWGPWRQITSVSGGERGGVTETEPIILENASPDDPEASGKLIVQVWDADQTTGDDFLCAACIKPRHPDDESMPLYYGQNLGEARYELWTNKEGEQGKGEMAGHITLDQIHFIQQKLQPYRGCKGQCCCCDENQPVCCCIETAKSASYRAKTENRKLYERQQQLGQKAQELENKD